jgi:4-alpha-glucanotransferase
MEAEQAARNKERKALWNMFETAKIVGGKLPTAKHASRVADAAVKFIAGTPSRLALLPLEDARAVPDQANVPGTIDKCPNWRYRYAGDAAGLLDPPDVRRRLAILAKRGAP